MKNRQPKPKNRKQRQETKELFSPLSPPTSDNNPQKTKTPTNNRHQPKHRSTTNQKKQQTKQHNKSNKQKRETKNLFFFRYNG
jgi:hypothetical protein